VNRMLLASGATISEINCVRRHLSAIKVAVGCRVPSGPSVTLLISDVPGDRPVDIASGPRWRTLPPVRMRSTSCAVRHRLTARARRAGKRAWRIGETRDPRLRGQLRIIATPQMPGSRAAVARAAGLETHILSDAIEGERATWAKYCGDCLQVADRNQP